MLPNGMIEYVEDFGCAATPLGKGLGDQTHALFVCRLSAYFCHRGLLNNIADVGVVA